MSARLRCTRGHFLPATPQPDDLTCRCVLTPRRRRPRPAYRFSYADLHGQGLERRSKRRLRTVRLKGSYL